MKFTEEQDAAIRASARNVLVAAAAGSGKTAVLVERIFRIITEEHVDIDRLLVVTFTRAAAAQMKERIRERIAKELSLHPDNAHLKRQETLLFHAQITTIDSFCQHVLRENIALLPVDPAYRIADEGEMTLLSAEAIDQTLHLMYEEADPAFLHLASYFSAQTTDAELEEHILALNRKAEAMPWPELWLDAQAEKQPDAASFEQDAAVSFCRNDVKALLENCLQRTKYALALCEEADGPYPYAPCLEDDLAMLEEVLHAVSGGTFDTMRAAVLNISFAPIGRVSKKDAVSEEKKERVQMIRGDVKDTVTDLQKRYFRMSAGENIQAEEETLPVIRALVEAVKRYRMVLDDMKKEQHLLDFSDIAHLALNILTDVQADADGTYHATPTRIAEEMRAYYREVMIDEYQDSNLIQEVIFETIAGKETGCTRFMVGDVKQSIYRFRLARPELFMEKLKKKDPDLQVILLHQNFRSRRQVLNTVNALFARLMDESLGGISYDADAALTYGGLYEPAEAGKENRYDTECMLCETKGDRTQFEAEAVAARIRRLVKEDGFSYRDIVILLRAPGGRDETYRRALEHAGIPVYVESRTGYFSAREVTVVLQMLNVLNNPLQDVALLSVMLSPIGLFTEEETATLRVLADEQGAHGYFFEAMQALTKEEESALKKDRSLFQKTTAFLDMIDDFRMRSGICSVRTLIADILDETGYLDAVSAMPDGARRSANLEMLLNRAAAFEKTGLRGLSRFVHFIESLKKAEADEGEANVLDENADVVRLMSIHKSKGLEFPVVFLAGCAKGFLRADAQKDLLLDTDFGMAVSLMNPEKRTRRSTLKKNVIARKILTDMLGEELRVLYVAMTRAKEKLIISGTVRDAEKEKERVQALSEMEERLSYAARAGANSYLQWIMTASVNGEKKEVLPLTLVTEADIKAEDAMDIVDTANRYEKLLAETETEAGQQMRERLRQRFSWNYGHTALQDLFSKTTVTELKARLAEESDVAYHPFSYTEEALTVPSFMREAEAKEKQVTGAARGTIYHKAMELLFSRGFAEKSPALTVSADEEALHTFLRKMEQEGRMGKGEADAVHVPDLLRFFETPLASRMEQAAKAGRLYTEKPFMMGVPASDLNLALPKAELLLIQGIIDCFFEEEGALVVLDYKTDRVQEASELVSRYAAQLDYYAKALSRITGKRVKERLIYSFALHQVIPIT